MCLNWYYRVWIPLSSALSPTWHTMQTLASATNFVQGVKIHTFSLLDNKTPCQFGWDHTQIHSHNHCKDVWSNFAPLYNYWLFKSVAVSWNFLQESLQWWKCMFIQSTDWMSAETMHLSERIGFPGKLQKFIQLCDCILVPSIGKERNLETIIWLTVKSTGFPKGLRAKFPRLSQRGWKTQAQREHGSLLELLVYNCGLWLEALLID